jgi:hypothetical protein
MVPSRSRSERSDSIDAARPSASSSSAPASSPTSSLGRVRERTERSRTIERAVCVSARTGAAMSCAASDDIAAAPSSPSSAAIESIRLSVARSVAITTGSTAMRTTHCPSGPSMRCAAYTNGRPKVLLWCSAIAVWSRRAAMISGRSLWLLIAATREGSSDESQRTTPLGSTSVMRAREASESERTGAVHRSRSSAFACCRATPTVRARRARSLRVREAKSRSSPREAYHWAAARPKAMMTTETTKSRRRIPRRNRSLAMKGQPSTSEGESAKR